MTPISSNVISDRMSGLLSPPHLPDRASGVAFADVLSDTNRTTDEATVREAATQLVSSAFLQPIFAQLRESSLAEGPFKAGAAERRFGPLLDSHLADHVAGATRFNLVDAIVNRLMPTAGDSGASQEAPIYA